MFFPIKLLINNYSPKFCLAYLFNILIFYFDINISVISPLCKYHTLGFFRFNVTLFIFNHLTIWSSPLFNLNSISSRLFPFKNKLESSAKKIGMVNFTKYCSGEPFIFSNVRANVGPIFTKQSWNFSLMTDLLVISLSSGYLDRDCVWFDLFFSYNLFTNKFSPDLYC